MEYALLAYGRSADRSGAIDEAIAALLARPSVTGWARLHADESATTLRTEAGKTVLTDGPFVDSKDYLGGFIVVEAESLDGALAVAEELQLMRTACAMEVRPVREEPLVDA